MGNALVPAWLRRRGGPGVHDIAPLRGFRRQALLDLGVRVRSPTTCSTSTCRG